jgi:MoaA/NifB/PqqE/SkfB family radical SAM enzyme
MSINTGETERYEISTKGIRRNIPPFRVCITWLINNKCNYRCMYCLNNFEEPPGFKILSPEDWFSVWHGIYQKYGTVSMQITGGEPTIYPNFFEILDKIGRMHYIDLQTNMSWDAQEFIKKVSTHSISRIGGSFHAEFAEFGSFLAKAVMLKNAGYRHVEINFVAHPKILPDAENYLAMAKERQVQFTVLSFQGEYAGKKYPESYLDAEKVMLKRLNISSGESAEAMANWDVEKKKVDKPQEAELPLRACRMGQMYSWVKPDGEAMRCCKSDLSLGNIINGTFNLFDEASPCKLTNCICWRNMTVGEEERWADRWPGTK